jgi:hypothetical protein
MHRVLASYSPIFLLLLALGGLAACEDVEGGAPDGGVVPGEGVSPSSTAPGGPPAAVPTSYPHTLTTPRWSEDVGTRQNGEACAFGRVRLFWSKAKTA